MGTRVYLTIVEGRFEEVNSSEDVQWDDLFSYAYGAGDDFSVYEPILKIEIDGVESVIQESAAMQYFAQAQLPGEGMYVVYSDTRSAWFSGENHNADDTWFACESLSSDMEAGKVELSEFSYSKEDKAWSYKQESISVGISCDVSSDEKVVVMSNNAIVEEPA
jgi:hypothetical protein